MKITIYLTFLILSVLWPQTIKSQNLKIKHSVTSPEMDSLNIQVLSEGFALDVTVFKQKQKKKMPAVIFLVGSGEGSTLASYKAFTKFFFDETFLQNGFAMVYFDKRGLGNSEGTWYETTFEQRALDARNVALEVREMDFISKDEIFVVGHSQGGWIVQIVLAEYPEIFAGGISMAGPTFSVRRQLVNDYKSNLICNKGMDGAVALPRATRKVNRDLFFISLLARRGNLKQLKIIKDFEPKQYLEAINKPLLMLFGENDPLVSPQWSMQALNEIFPAGLPGFIEYYLAPGQNHAFKLAPKCFTGKREDLFYSEKTRQILIEWIKGQSASQ